MDEHGGALPDEAEALRALPGIGRYTAGAVASIAFDKPEAIVDGNVARVLARLFEIREGVKSPAAQRRLWDEAAALARGPSPGDLNQALMELGATLCTPKSPSCEVCPLRRRCAARAAGDPESLPVKAKKTPPPPRAGRGRLGRATRQGAGGAPTAARTARGPLGAAGRRAGDEGEAGDGHAALARDPRRPAHSRRRRRRARGARLHPPAFASPRLPVRNSGRPRAARRLRRPPLGQAVGARGATPWRSDAEGASPSRSEGADAT